MKSFFSDRYPGWVVSISVVSLLLCLASSLLGFFISERPEDYVPNLLSGIAGVFLSISIALLIVDSLIKHYEKRRWNKVRNTTYKAITSHLCDLLQVMIIHFHQDTGDLDLMSSITAGREHPNPDTVIGMAKLSERLRELPSTINSEKTISDVSVEYYEEVQWDLDQIRDVLTPRVIQSSDEQKVIDALIEFDDARRKLHNSIIVEKQLKMNQVLPDVIGLVEKAQKLYRELVND